MENRFTKLVEIMDTLRNENGCPWDREQTTDSIKPYLLEETYEVLDAIEQGSTDDLKKELGDLLYQIVFHARIAKEEGKFDIGEVIQEIHDKMLRRHPHVFGKENIQTSREVLEKWETIKKSEKKESASLLENIPSTLPALLKAQKIQEKVSRVGFDWNTAEEVINKIEEELGEFKAALKEKNQTEMENELGDLIFSIVNMSRFVKIDSETALRKCNRRFIDRFNFIEEEAKKSGREIRELSQNEMEALWEKAKRRPC